MAGREVNIRERTKTKGLGQSCLDKKEIKKKRKKVVLFSIIQKSRVTYKTAGREPCRLLC